MDDSSADQSATKLRREPPPRWLRVVGFLVAYCLLLPLTYVLRVFGIWPRLIARMQRHFQTSFGTYRPCGHDVLVAAYHKSGTKWTMQIAQQIAHYGNAEFEHIHDVVPWPDIGSDVAYAVEPSDSRAAEESPTGLRVIKTHLPLGNVPYVRSSKYICVVRDPKDVVVSSYFFLRSIMLGPLMPSLAEWNELFLSNEGIAGDWAVHLQSYWRARDRDNVLFLRFEEMKADPGAAVDRIADLMGVELSAEQRAAVIEKSSFEYMQSIGEKFDPVGIAAPWANAAGSMIRRGKSNTSSEYLSKPERDAIDKHWSRRLESLGSDFPYDRYYAAEPVAE